ncbi:hypothetical protein MMC13_006973 [Lambiella insularis]|nr:hypothetical protein [Lambiella insularis]
MGIKWTAENDQILLLKILETSNVAIDTKAVSAAWPADSGEVPTARAITERIVKIRQLTKAKGGSHFVVSNATTIPKTKKSSATSSANVTPRKSRAKKADANKADTPGSQKRKRDVEYVEVDDDEEVGGQVKMQVDDKKLYADDGGSPAKKLKMEEVKVKCEPEEEYCDADAHAMSTKSEWVDGPEV